MRRFERKQNIFRNKDALGESYRPDQIEERDEEIEEYMDALQPVVDGWEPNNIFLYGNTGVGKTAVTDYLLDRLKNDVADYDDVDLAVISVNCKTLNSSYQVAVELVNKLRPAGGEISSTGYPQQTVFKKLYKELEAIGGTILIVLDEVDSIGDRDELLYELPRARANNNLDSTKVGVIGISNDFKFRDQLDPRVQDTLCERELQFPPYDAPELENILESRAEVAIAADAVEQGVLKFCAALAARDSGSARQALDLLRLAGEIAENREVDLIERDHVEAARSRLEQERVEEGMRELTTHGRLALLAVVSKAAKEETPSRTREIYEEYTALCDSSGTDSLAQRSVHNHLSDLRMLGILSAYENRSGSRGNYYSYELDVPFTSAIEAMSDVLRLNSEIETIRDIASMNNVA
ncbi:MULTISPECIES: orc1/cdc6 family replication initiation protein [Halorubrum]|uniref:orc1/cdc6 family replication initiation protein n=1 Tax=Halorubrum TaxID=56688 RepID=UPI000C0B957D|nr:MULTISPECIES: orc1/cdc6 family replication initiation protein [Halorubrum]PHQ44387.1 cell division control protein Cdc6 [Halorubrum sp. C3]MDB9253945.1 orc1/cdc6 family replication initiation protein [Halorubrum ezzemoulense]MDB9257139.1 orc1/cdc6 family replication initiation protein [Halorubrum ezzemoulense]MDB9263829.1 orc1/cdc6 family replication initiation protein [Halorubrum ezzemoulense]MDB9274828.1 orc1/cdc6 family replication initiation protein [Halorubrum ezzemoulense]